MPRLQLGCYESQSERERGRARLQEDVALDAGRLASEERMSVNAGYEDTDESDLPGRKGNLGWLGGMARRSDRGRYGRAPLWARPEHCVDIDQ